MDYSYLNQAAASFDTQCLQSMDPTGLNMPCSYGDITSCNQMSQAAYRYTAAAATMARSYNPAGVGPGNGMSALHHTTPVTQCSVMGARQDVHRASMFPSSMNLQSKLHKIRRFGWRTMSEYLWPQIRGKSFNCLLTHNINDLIAFRLPTFLFGCHFTVHVIV